MKNILLSATAVATLMVVSPAAAQNAHSLAEDAAAFGARQAVSGPGLSPDGASVLYLTPGPGPKTYAVISNLQTGKSNVMVSTDGSPESLFDCTYSAADRAVCGIYAIVDTIGYKITMTRRIAMNLDGSSPKLLGQPQRDTDAYLRQFDASVLDWRGARDGKILMQRQYVPEAGKIGSNIIDNKEGLGVDLVDTRTLRATTVEPVNRQSSGYMTDRRGNVRLMSVNEEERGGKTTGRTRYFYRTPDSRDWKSLVGYQEEKFEPEAIDADLNALYALKKKDGRMALYRIKLDGSMAETLVAENPKYDIAGVFRSGDGQRVIGYTVFGEKRERIYFDPEFKALAESLHKALPKLPIISFVDATNDGNKILIFAGSDQDPGRFYVFDRKSKSLNEAMLARPELEGYTLATMKPVTITGADGVQIPAYLTLPPGKDPKNLPAVIMPHGGPGARDYWGFDWLSQFFAARGYAVIQPQFRGSTGYGDVWKNENALKNWRAAMTDVAASAKWLSAQGIANPDRMAIFGWSYGGYAALMSAETNPELYKTVIAVAPVTDFAMLKEDVRDYSSSKIVEKMIGNGIEVIRGSPLKNAAKIRVPVLLVHGDKDVNVDFRHSQKMNDELKSLGKPVEFLSYKGLDHQLPDASARAEMLRKAAELLDKTIGH
ncbi:MAG: S9 family peptidase [Sphingomonas sp.]|nr:S9 family peptidase [Sphingomonas sp.]